MSNNYIKLFWPEIMYSYARVGYETSKLGIKEFDEENYWGLKFE
jgi:hypothetical protein